MPVPAGFQPIDAAATAPPGFQPISIADAYSKQSGNSPDSPEGYLGGLYKSTVGPAVDLAKGLATHPIDTVAGIGKAVIGTQDLDDIAKAVKDGNYKDAALRVGKWAQEGPGGRMAHGIVDPVVTDLQKGDYAGAAGRATGVVLTLGAPALAEADVLPAAGDVAAAVKGAASGAYEAATKPVQYGRFKLPLPQPLAGAAAGGYAGRMVGLPHAVGAVAGAAYPIIKGAITGAKEALASRVAAAAETATAEASDPVLASLAKIRTGGKGGFSSLNAEDQQAVREMAQQFHEAGNPGTKPPLPPDGTPLRGAGAPAPANALPPDQAADILAGINGAPSAPALNSQGAPAAQLPEAPRVFTPPAPPDASGPIAPILPENLRNPAPPQVFNPRALLSSPGRPAVVTPAPPDASGPIPPVLPENVRNPPVAQIPANATPDVVNKFSPTDIAKWLQKRHQAGESPVTGQADTPSIARRLRDELIANGTPPESIAAPDVPEPDLEGSLRDMMRGQPKGGPKAIADSNYAGGGHEDPEVAGKVYEAAARSDKAVKLAQSMHQHGITYADLAAHPAEDVVELLKPVSKGLGINPPSKSTLGEILFNLQRLEKAAPKSALESQLEQSLAARGAK